MWPDQVSNTGPPTYESGALPTALHGLAPVYLNGLHEYSNICISQAEIIDSAEDL